MNRLTDFRDRLRVSTTGDNVYAPIMAGDYEVSVQPHTPVAGTVAPSRYHDWDVTILGHLSGVPAEKTMGKLLTDPDFSDLWIDGHFPNLHTDSVQFLLHVLILGVDCYYGLPEVAIEQPRGVN